MKKLNLSILTISVFSLVLVTLLFQACRKPKPSPKDPCRNPELVTATEQDMYYLGHFKVGNPDNTETYLYANNWNEYASRVIPGKQYRIGYKEVACDPNKGCYDQRTGGSNIREGGCVVYPTKCIMIKCLEEVGGGCFETQTDPSDFENAYSSATQVSGISGNSLKATVGFSGCGPEDARNFKLYATESPQRSSRGCPIWIAKAVNTFSGYTCEAYFTKNVCFDLTPIKNRYQYLNRHEKEVIIRMVVGEETKEFLYTF